MTTSAQATSTREAAQTLGEAIAEVQSVIVGQEHMVEQLMVGLLAKGHVLLEGVPGTAKTLAVRTFAQVVGGDFARIQFTPDLVPSDIVGTRIYSAQQERFDISLGPVFVNFVLADEINRAPAKVQSAMLELMAEKQVSIGGKTHPVPQRACPRCPRRSATASCTRSTCRTRAATRSSRSCAACRSSRRRPARSSTRPG